jgi:hypothetical protein
VTNATRRSFASELLSFLEYQESRLLNWGFYDVGFLPDEIERLLDESAPPELREQWQQLQAGGVRLPRFLTDMEQAGLLYRPRENPNLLRTRFAESIRLLARLRQMFRAQDWATGPRLVRDIKMDLRARRYPKRNISTEEAWRTIAHAAPGVDKQRAVFDALSINRAGEPTPYSGFQVRAFARIASQYHGRSGIHGTIVSAGTGAGKTKAFYVPALLGVAADIARAPQPFTKVFAIYPRNVLLADQLREAISEIQKLAPVLRSRGQRGITVGAYLGDTPPEGAFRAKESLYLKNWKQDRQGWILPFLKSPRGDDSELLWRDQDRNARRTALYRIGASSSEPPIIEDGVIELTREGLQRRPPDILFLSLEMLNREIGNPVWARTFGIDHGGNPPRLLLLDEVHTHEGLTGAQLPWILQRWLHAVQPPGLHVVGLSATLRDATQHLATIAGISPGRIQEVSPIEDPDSQRSEYLSEGIEYNVALRGRTSAGASLLATSIQTTMLLTRLLTPEHRPSPAGDDRIEGSSYYARKLFGFTDNLDTLNRWLADLVDADNNRHLAALRTTRPNGPPPTDAAFRDGQVWELAELIGHNLHQGLLIDRCSSQEPGVDSRAQAVLATSALEVGYDDPEVGVVLQHKAPVSMASFIQRKGRAGRRRGTRPLSVVVLSDFGRDRWAFRDSHRLFGTTIEGIRLPVLNPYVLKVQSALFLVDWIGRQIGRPDPFRYLGQDSDTTARSLARQLLERLLGGGEDWNDFHAALKNWIQAYLANARTAADTQRYLDVILWEAPRPLIRHVIPALIRQLDPLAPVQPPARRGRPIPEYIPPATFSELDSRDIRVVLAAAAAEGEASLDLRRFLYEICPGRVSKRFSTGVNDRGYWPPVSQLLDGSRDVEVQLDQVCTDSALVRHVGQLPVFEPYGVRLEPRPTNIKDSSHGSWDIQTSAEPIGPGLDVAHAGARLWHGVFSRKRVHLHRDHDGLHLTRYANSGSYEILGDRDRVLRGRFQLVNRAPDTDELQTVAIGFAKRCDAFVLDVDPQHLNAAPDLGHDFVQRARVDAFLDQLLRSEELRARANTFSIGHVWQSSLAMLTATALRQRCSLEQAQTLLRGKRAEAAENAISRLLTGSADAEDDAAASRSRRQVQIVNLWRDPTVVAVLEVAERVLWASAGQLDPKWLRRRYLHTLAQSLYSAVLSVLPDVPEGDLTVDLLEDAGQVSIALSETIGGGLGHIETLFGKLSSDPTEFDDAVLAALLQCERAATAGTLLEAISRDHAGTLGTPLADAFESVRGARAFSALDAARRSLRKALFDSGLDSSREAVSAMMGTLLRQGSSTITDRWSRGLNALWCKKSQSLGIVIPSAAFAYWVSRTPAYQRRLARALASLSGQVPSEGQVFLIAEGMLLEGCEDSCAECLGTGESSDSGTKPSRVLAQQWLGLHPYAHAIMFGEDGWTQRVQVALRRHARTIVRVDADQIGDAAVALFALPVSTIEADYLRLTPSLVSVARKGRSWFLTWQIRGLVGEN